MERLGKLLHEFKEFASRGNVLDLAVGVIIGGAFNKIVSSLVGDIFLPVLGVIVGGINFTNLHFEIRGIGSTPVVIRYGNFLQTSFDFLLMAVAVFIVVRAVNALRRLQDEQDEVDKKDPPLTREELLLTEIRDLLKRDKERPI